MTSRRGFLAGLIATGVAPVPGWADAGAPAYLAAAARADGSFALCGIAPDLSVVFQLPLPDRGHAAAAHPHRPEAVAFARRPGTFAVVLDCVNGAAQATLHAPAGRHFYGHGAFSRNGDWLYTTENDFEAGRGCIGVWDTRNGYVRAGECDSGGIGPHDIKRLPGRETLVVANGGIDTHPDSGRSKLNIATMAPNLSYIDAGAVTSSHSLPSTLHKNSIRHLAVSAGGRVAFGMQWQGDGDAPPLVGVHDGEGDLQLLEAPDADRRALQGYIGSIALGPGSVVVTSPRGGVVQVYHTDTLRLKQSHDIADACGVAGAAAGVVVTSGSGALCRIAPRIGQARTSPGLRWDNHLIRI